MLHLLPEVSLGMADIRVASPGMVRVVNVRSVLQKAKYRGNGRIALQILDPQVPENNKTFAVTFAGGKAVSVSETEDNFYHRAFRMRQDYSFAVSE
jgi:predicted acetyltransferase